MGKLLNKVRADEAAAVPSTVVETTRKLDVNFARLKETPVAIGTHEAGETFAEDVGTFVERRSQASVGEKGVTVHRWHVEVKDFIVFDPAQGRGLGGGNVGRERPGADCPVGQIG